MIGVINVLKEPGYSSHDVVARLRRVLGQKQIGHGGTLDPGAAGVLPVLVGKATKLMPFTVDHKKSYRAELTLGVVTDTQDASGETVSVNTGFSLPPRALGDVLATFVGEIEQVPPMTSALKHEGRRLYELAREGREVEREPRRVSIFDIHVRRILPEGSSALVAGSRVLIDVTCSKGTYIRTLCHDIGRRLGCGAHMSFLVRTSVGPLKLEESVSLEEIEAARRDRRLCEYVLPPEVVLGDVPRVEVDEGLATAVRHGQALSLASCRFEGRLASGDLVRVHRESGGLLCIAKVEGKRVQPVRVL